MPLGRDRPRDRFQPAPGSVGARASGHRPLLRGLHRAAHRPPADGDPAAAGQGRRLGVDPRRRPRLQAAELDEPALHAQGGADDDGAGTWTVTNKAGEQLIITIEEVAARPRRTSSASTPACRRTASRRELQRLLAAHVETFGAGWSLVRREYPTAIGPVDLLCRDAGGAVVAVEIKRRGEIDGVEQLTRYLELLNRDPLLAPVQGRLRRPGDQAAGPGAGRRPRHRLRDRRLRRPQGHRRPHGAPLLDPARAPPGQQCPHDRSRAGPRTDTEDVLAMPRAPSCDEAVAAAQPYRLLRGALPAGHRSPSRRAIDDGVFDDGDRLSRLDAAFANRYLHALHAWHDRRGAAPELADGLPRAASSTSPVLVQHLVLGVNAAHQPGPRRRRCADLPGHARSAS